MLHYMPFSVFSLETFIIAGGSFSKKELLRSTPFSRTYKGTLSFQGEEYPGIVRYNSKDGHGRVLCVCDKQHPERKQELYKAYYNEMNTSHRALVIKNRIFTVLRLLILGILLYCVYTLFRSFSGNDSVSFSFSITSCIFSLILYLLVLRLFRTRV